MMEMQTLDFTNPLLEAIGDQPTSRTIKMTNNSFCKRTETMTGFSVQAEQSAEFVLIGEMAYQMLKNNLRQQNSGSDTRVWSLFIDGKEVDLDPVADDADTGSDTPAATLTFSQLQNCTYDGQQLTYTSGNLEISSEPGYMAVSEKPCNVEFVIPTGFRMALAFGDSLNLSKYELENHGVAFVPGAILANGTFTVLFNDDGTAEVNAGDTIQATMHDGAVTFKNVTNGKVWDIPAAANLNPPKYLMVMGLDTEPLRIKAI